MPLSRHLPTLLPALRAIVIGFFVAAVFWRSHHAFFRCLAKGDGTLMWLNFLLLFAVAVTPLSTYLLGNFHTEAVTVGLYAANVALIGAGLFLMWLRVALKRALLHADVDTGASIAVCGARASPRSCSSPRFRWRDGRPRRRCGCGC